MFLFWFLYNALKSFIDKVLFVANGFKKQTEYKKCSSFNIWRFKVSEMNIADLCILHEEQKLEKNALIDHFQSLSNQNSINSLSNIRRLVNNITKNYETQEKSKKFSLWKKYSNKVKLNKFLTKLFSKTCEKLQNNHKHKIFNELINFSRKIQKINFFSDKKFTKTIKKIFFYWKKSAPQWKLKKNSLKHCIKIKIKTQKKFYFSKLSKIIDLKKNEERNKKLFELEKSKENLEFQSKQTCSLIEDSNQLLSILEKKLSSKIFMSLYNHLKKKNIFHILRPSSIFLW